MNKNFTNKIQISEKKIQNQNLTAKALDREIKNDILKQNNKTITDQMRQLIDYATGNKKSKDLKNKENLTEIYSHRLFVEIKYILDNLESSDLTFNNCIEKLGKSLREDFNQETPVKDQNYLI